MHTRQNLNHRGKQKAHRNSLRIEPQVLCLPTGNNQIWEKENILPTRSGRRETVYQSDLGELRETVYQPDLGEGKQFTNQIWEN